MHAPWTLLHADSISRVMYNICAVSLYPSLSDFLTNSSQESVDTTMQIAVANAQARLKQRSMRLRKEDSGGLQCI